VRHLSREYSLISYSGTERGLDETPFEPLRMADANYSPYIALIPRMSPEPKSLFTLSPGQV